MGVNPFFRLQLTLGRYTFPTGLKPGVNGTRSDRKNTRTVETEQMYEMIIVLEHLSSPYLGF
jgi:hypothetical protein